MSCVAQATTVDADQSVAKQPEASALSSGSAVLSSADYEAIPEDEWIASDMTMYDSPLAELERLQCHIGDVTFIPAVPASHAESETVPDAPEGTISTSSNADPSA